MMLKIATGKLKYIQFVNYFNETNCKWKNDDVETAEIGKEKQIKDFDHQASIINWI